VTGDTAHETVTCDARAFPPRHPGWSREARGDARPRGMAVQGRASGPDRTRLTDRLAFISAAVSSAWEWGMIEQNKNTTFP
jgi:hypothetical protein